MTSTATVEVTFPEWRARGAEHRGVLYIRHDDILTRLATVRQICQDAHVNRAALEVCDALIRDFLSVERA